MNQTVAPTQSGMGTVYFRGGHFQAEKRFWHGTHRTVPPDETLARIRPHAKTIGLTRLADITGLDRIGIHTVLAQRPNCPTLANAAGKGYTLVAATVSAAMEALEIYHAENLRLERLWLTYHELAEKYQVIPQDKLSLTKRSLFNPRRMECWVLGWDLLNQSEVAVPHSCVGMIPPPGQNPARWMPFAMGTNGLAGGNHFLEALSAALYEVVERDAIACQRIAASEVAHEMPRVRLETISSPLVLDLMDRFHTAALMPILFDCTVDIDVPCYMAIIYDLKVRNAGLFRGYGAHLDPVIAMIRALTEAAQARTIAIAGSRDDYFRRDQKANRLADTEAGVARLESFRATVDARERRTEATDSFGGDITVVIEKLRQAGLQQVIVLDLSHAEIDIPVVRVIVPGLEGYMFDHYSPGPRARAFTAAADGALSLST